MENIKKDLLCNSKSFCILPWIHLHVMPDSTVIPCCISPYDDHYGDGKVSSLKEIINSEKFKKIRMDMLSGQLPAGCERCHQIESIGLKSMRQRMNKRFAHHLDFVDTTFDDGTIKNISFKYIDIRFSNLCNFKCRGCGPTLSSSWYEDHQELFGYKSDQEKIKNVSANSPKFWAEIESVIPHAEEIYFGGGEPLITKEHYDVLKRLDSLAKYDVVLCYNTNLSQLNYGGVDLSEMWSKFRYVSIGVSLDDIEKRAEYFRHGTKWEIILRNMLRLKENFKNIHLYINCTVNIMNVLYLPEIYEYLLNNKIIGTNDFNINMLLDPHELTIQVLPIELKRKVEHKLRLECDRLLKVSDDYKKFVSDLESIIEFMNREDREDLLPLFKERTLKLDSLRNENFLKTFPELKELMSKDNEDIIV